MKLENDVRRVIDRRLSGMETARDFESKVLFMAKGEKKMKKKISVGLIFTVVLMLAAFGALAASVDWNVLDFLFWNNVEEQRGAALQGVNAKLEKNHTLLMVNSALTDGKTLAFDWTVQNLTPDDPVYLQIDEFTVNGAPVSTDGTDGFDCQWLPGWCNDGAMQDGENVRLPDGVTGDTLNVFLRVGAYRPKAPIYRMDAFDAAVAKQKMDEGFYVLCEGDGFVVQYPDEGVLHVFGRIEESELSRYERTELVIAFELGLGGTETNHFIAEEQYVFPGFTAAYKNAAVTPVALYLEIDVTPVPDTGEARVALYDGRFAVTDGEGNVLEFLDAYPHESETYSPVGSNVIHYYHHFFGVPPEDLPDVLAVSWIPKDGQPLVMPVKVR